MIAHYENNFQTLEKNKFLEVNSILNFGVKVNEDRRGEAPPVGSFPFLFFHVSPLGFMD